VELVAGDLFVEEEVGCVPVVEGVLESTEVSLVVGSGDEILVRGVAVFSFYVEFLLESGEGRGEVSGEFFVLQGVCGEPGEVVFEGGLGEAVVGCLGWVVVDGVGEDAAEVQ